MKSENDIFCIDANIFIFIFKNYPSALVQGLWKKFDELFNAGVLMSHSLVFDEICHDKKNPDELAKWLRPKEKHFYKVSQKQTEHLPEVLKNFPKLINHESFKNQADPWIISMILELKDTEWKGKTVIVVSNENKKSPQKIPAACKHYKIKHLDLIEFIEYCGWKVQID